MRIADNIPGGRTICAFGEACSWPVQSFVAKFKDEFVAKGAADEERRAEPASHKLEPPVERTCKLASLRLNMSTTEPTSEPSRLLRRSKRSRSRWTARKSRCRRRCRIRLPASRSHDDDPGCAQAQGRRAALLLSSEAAGRGQLPHVPGRVRHAGDGAGSQADHESGRHAEDLPNRRGRRSPARRRFRRAWKFTPTPRR